MLLYLQSASQKSISIINSIIFNYLTQLVSPHHMQAMISLELARNWVWESLNDLVLYAHAVSLRQQKVSIWLKRFAGSTERTLSLSGAAIAVSGSR